MKIATAHARIAQRLNKPESLIPLHLVTLAILGDGGDDLADCATLEDLLPRIRLGHFFVRNQHASRQDYVTTAERVRQAVVKHVEDWMLADSELEAYAKDVATDFDEAELLGEREEEE